MTLAGETGEVVNKCVKLQSSNYNQRTFADNMQTSHDKVKGRRHTVDKMLTLLFSFARFFDYVDRQIARTVREGIPWKDVILC